MSIETESVKGPEHQAEYIKLQYNRVQARSIQKMFSQASLQICHLLEQLSNLYKQYSIKYEINHCYDSLMRMLTPFELLTYYNLKTPISMLNQQFVNQFIHQLPPINSNSSSNFNLPDPQHWKKIIKPRIIVQLKNQKLKEADIISEFSNQPTVENTYQATRNKLNNGGRPILELAEQMSVQNFMRNTVSKGNTLTMPQIANYAKRISRGNRNFMGSVGWVKNFMKRYPEMRQLYEYSRYGKTGVRFPGSIKISQQLKVGAAQQNQQNNKQTSKDSNPTKNQFKRPDLSENKNQEQEYEIYEESEIENIYDDITNSKESGLDQIQLPENIDDDNNYPAQSESENDSK